MSDLKYTQEHEWLRREADGSVTLGITDYAMDYMRERECINFRISFKQDATDVTNYVIKVPSVASKGSALINTLRSAAPVISAVAAAATFVAKLPNTKAYVERVAARPAYIKAMSIAGPAASRKGDS